MTRHWFALALFTGLAGFGFPVAAEDQPDSPAIIAVRKLTHPKFAEREAADRQLRQLGADAVTALKMNFERLDSEGQMRARKIVAAIDEQALNARLLVPPHIRLQYKDTPLTEALKDLNAKTGLQFALNDKTVAGKNVTLDTGEVPLWEGIERFLAATKLTEAVVPGPLGATSNTYYSGRTTVRYSGYMPAVSAARLVGLTAGVRESVADLKSAVRVQTMPRAHPVNQRVGGSNELTLGLDLAAPASFGLRSILGVDATRVEDDLHQVLAQKLTPGESRTASPYEYGNMAFGGGFQIQGQGVLILDGISQPTMPTGLNAHQTSLTLNLGKLRSTRLTVLEGTIHAVALMPEEPIRTFTDLQKPGEQLHQAGGFEFRIKEVKELKKGHWTIRCSYESSSTINSRPWSNEGETVDNQVGSYDFSSNNGLPKLSFNDQNGKPIKKTNTNIVGQQYRSNNQGMILTSEILITVLPVDDQLPKELVVSGRRIAALKVPFALKDVQLP